MLQIANTAVSAFSSEDQSLFRCRTKDRCLVHTPWPAAQRYPRRYPLKWLRLLLLDIDDCMDSSLVCNVVPQRPCVPEVPLRRILRAVDRTLPCGAASFSVERLKCVYLGRWISVSYWMPSLSSHRYPTLDNAWEVFSSVLGTAGEMLVRSKDILLIRAESGTINPITKSLFRHDSSPILWYGSHELCAVKASLLLLCQKKKKEADSPRFLPISAQIPSCCWWTKSLPAIGHQFWHSATIIIIET
jgi:hypothetical protein